MLTDTPPAGECVPESNNNEKVLPIPLSSGTGASPTDAV